MSLKVNELQILYHVSENPFVLLTENEKDSPSTEELLKLIDLKVEKFIASNFAFYRDIQENVEREKILQALKQLEETCPKANRIREWINQFNALVYQGNDSLILTQPIELFRKQLSYAIENLNTFYNLSLVNRHFNKALSEPLLIQEIFEQPIAELTGNKGKKACAFLIFISQKNEKLEKLPLKLDFSFCDDIEDKDLVALSKTFPYLHSLALSNKAPITSNGICDLIANCPHLQKITCVADNTVLEALSKHCKTLKNITILTSPYLDPVQFSQYDPIIVDKHINLKNLSLLESLESIVVPYCHESIEIVALEKKWPKLQFFYITQENGYLSHEAQLALVTTSDQLTFFDPGPECTEEQFSELLDHLGNLESLVISSSLSPKFGQLLAQKCTKLTELNVCLPSTLGSEFLKSYLLEGPNSLQHLDLPYVDNFQLLLIAKCCPKLKKIYINNTDCDDATIEKFAKECPYLESISLANVSYPEITDLAIISLAQNCKNLKALCFENSSTITLSCLEVIGMNLHNLESLIVEQCEFRDSFRELEKGLNAIAEGCRKLKEIGLSSFPQLPEEALAKLIIANPKLQVIKVPRLSTAMYEILAKYCFNLKCLTINIAKLNIPESSYKTLLKNNPSIRIGTLAMEEADYILM